MSARIEYARKHGKLIGVGSCREVYKTPRGKYVYKFDRPDSPWYATGLNIHEYHTYQNLIKNYTLPDGVKLPKMKLIDGVLVAEYIKGKHPEGLCCDSGHYCGDESKCWSSKLKGLPLRDMHRYNVIVTKDGTLYLIDLGHSSTNLDLDD